MPVGSRKYGTEVQVGWQWKKSQSGDLELLQGEEECRDGKPGTQGCCWERLLSRWVHGGEQHTQHFLLITGVGGEGPARSHIPKDRVTVPGREVNRVYHSRQRNWERSFYLPTSSHIADSPEQDVTLDILRDSAQNALKQTKKFLAAILTLFPPVWKKREKEGKKKRKKKMEGKRKLFLY